MRNWLIIIIAVVLNLACAVAEVDAQRRYIVWSGEKGCGQRGSGIEAGETVECISIDTPRGKVSGFIHNALSIAVAIAEDGETFILSTQIRDDGESTIEFDTDTWGAAHFASVKPGIERKLLAAETAIPSRDLMKKISTAASQDTSIDAYMADVARTTELREQRRSDGTRYRTTVITPDQDAKRIASDRGTARQAMASEEKSRIRSSAITRKWLAADNTIKGLVYFRRLKKAGLVIFSLKVADTTYIYRFNPNQPTAQALNSRNQ